MAAPIQTGYRAACDKIEALLTGDGGKFALPNPLGQPLGESGGFFLAMHGDEFVEGGAKRGFGEEIDIDAVEYGLGEGFADIGERRAAGVGRRQFVEGARM